MRSRPPGRPGWWADGAARGLGLLGCRGDRRRPPTPTHFSVTARNGRAGGDPLPACGL
jgi:hypothetical protein